MDTQTRFFYDHAGYSYDPKTQTPDQGRLECATLLARAESVATEHGYSFRWDIDPDITAADFSDDDYALWVCVMYDPDGYVIGSLGGIDFGPGGESWGDAYRRVIEAELALEHI